MIEIPYELWLTRDQFSFSYAINIEVPSFYIAKYKVLDKFDEQIQEILDTRLKDHKHLYQYNVHVKEDKV